MTDAAQKKRSTIYDVANETNLSIATVSRIINRKGSYSKRSAKTVMDAVKKLGYIHGSGSATHVSDSRTIGMYLPKETAGFEYTSYYGQFMLGASEEAISSGYDILICRNRDEEPDGRVIHFDPERFSALVVPYFPDSIVLEVEEMIKDGLPVAYAGHQLPGDTYGNNIYGGYIHCRREVLDLLYSLNYRNIVAFEMFRQSRNLSLIEDFRKLLENFRIEKGLSEDECRMAIYDRSVTDHFQILLQSILDSPNRPEVLFTDSAEAAVSAYNIIQNAGLNIPGDIGIISGSHSERSGEEFLPALTTVCVNAREMGRRSVRLLIGRVAGEGDEIERNVPYTIHIRDSLFKFY